ncbi:hypothetical protein H2266_07220 [Campylobacter sp. RM10543]|uniref:hypothetical protein n=1 Tax=Campylobacter molothri TaxID=1032242 RepID=UPI00301D9712|nr:hypothetical protein [Campylobacter sp. RM10543]
MEVKNILPPFKDSDIKNIGTFEIDKDKLNCDFYIDLNNDEKIDIMLLSQNVNFCFLEYKKQNDLVNANLPVLTFNSRDSSELKELGGG